MHQTVKNSKTRDDKNFVWMITFIVYVFHFLNEETIKIKSVVKAWNTVCEQIR